MTKEVEKALEVEGKEVTEENIEKVKEEAKKIEGPWPIDFSKVKTIEDVCTIMATMGLGFSYLKDDPKGEADYKKLEHLLGEKIELNV
jgi:hypothetical protein